MLTLVYVEYPTLCTADTDFEVFSFVILFRIFGVQDLLFFLVFTNTVQFKLGELANKNFKM